MFAFYFALSFILSNYDSLSQQLLLLLLLIFSSVDVIIVHFCRYKNIFHWIGYLLYIILFLHIGALNICFIPFYTILCCIWILYFYRYRERFGRQSKSAVWYVVVLLFFLCVSLFLPYALHSNGILLALGALFLFASDIIMFLRFLQIINNNLLVLEKILYVLGQAACAYGIYSLSCSYFL